MSLDRNVSVPNTPIVFVCDISLWDTRPPEQRVPLEVPSCNVMEQTEPVENTETEEEPDWRISVGRK